MNRPAVGLVVVVMRPLGSAGRRTPSGMLPVQGGAGRTLLVVLRSDGGSERVVGLRERRQMGSPVAAVLDVQELQGP